MSRALPPSAIKRAIPEAESRDVELTILMPCLNEAETIATCIDKAHGFLARSGVAGEILIADNGSSDGSVEYALARGARVIAVTERGYGAALRAGIAAARGRYVIVGDADDTTISPVSSRSSPGCEEAPTSSWAIGSQAASPQAPCRSCTAISEIPCSA
jgi:Glycosyl transferase family 2